MLSVLLDEPLYAVDLISPEPATMLQSDGIEPEFGRIILTLNMNDRQRSVIGEGETHGVWAREFPHSLRAIARLLGV
jgi:hypothetical protein